MEGREVSRGPFALVCLGTAVSLAALAAARLVGSTPRDLVAGLVLLGLPIALLVLAVWLWPWARGE